MDGMQKVQSSSNPPNRTEGEGGGKLSAWSSQRTGKD